MTVTRSGDLEDLVEPVADIEHRDAVDLQLADGLEKGVDFLVREGRGGLVEDEDLRVEAQGLGDFHHLLRCDAEIGDARVEIHRHLQASENLPACFLMAA